MASSVSYSPPCAAETTTTVSTDTRGRTFSQSGTSASSTSRKRSAAWLHDERELLGREAQVQGVDHASGQRHAQVRLEVGGVVPHQGGHAIAGAEARARQRLGELTCPRGHLPVGGPVKRAIRQARDHRDRGKHPLGADQEAVQRQREVHHRAERGHRAAPSCDGSGGHPLTDRAGNPRSQRADVEPVARRASSSR